MILFHYKPKPKLHPSEYIHLSFVLICRVRHIARMRTPIAFPPLRAAGVSQIDGAVRRGVSAPNHFSAFAGSIPGKARNHRRGRRRVRPRPPQKPHRPYAPAGVFIPSLAKSPRRMAANLPSARVLWCWNARRSLFSYGMARRPV